MDAGKIQKGDHIFYVAFSERSARLFEVEVQEVYYPGTTHEAVVGHTYDVETGQFVGHNVRHELCWLDKATALDNARIQLINEMQQLRAKAMSLGFHLR